MHVGLDVRPAHGAPLLSPLRTAAPEHPAEQVAEVADVEAAEVEVDVLAARPRPTVRRAEAVVLLALVLVGEDVVRALHPLERILGFLVARVLVRVILARELAVGLLDLVL